MDRSIELRHFRYMLAVAEAGTFTGAAARLGMTQPALSRAIRDLEEVVGTALFERGRQGAVLTAAGRTFRDDARALDEAARAALSRNGPSGMDRPHLRLTARGCDVGTLEHLVTSYNSARGDHLEARGAVVNASEHVDEVRDGRTAATLVRSPDDFSGLDSDLIRSDPRVALLPDAHPLATRRMIERAELAGETIPLWAGHTPEQTAFWTATDLVRHDWRAGPTVSDAAQYGGVIRLGSAVGFLAADLLPEMVLTGISVVPVADISPSELRIVWSRDATSRDVARFVRHTAQVSDDWRRSAPVTLSASVSD
ncbi:LysR family transcriptional regulator [Micromonospora sp. WMMD1155]|uniref:LysR family transcriptional regulator n=1 Tax=Micromonospora sp. WMMD1155 TaxID=3016094 RepID=UPI00249C240D|nr:LysR family transcriptional regulator [Micromonospora sp. WMMD1155]WFE53262.1 LysR family transcriptional regulator [Micromonospora sp. WMMD1155]